MFSDIAKAKYLENGQNIRIRPELDKLPEGTVLDIANVRMPKGVFINVINNASTYKIVNTEFPDEQWYYDQVYECHKSPITCVPFPRTGTPPYTVKDYLQYFQSLDKSCAYSGKSLSTNDDIVMAALLLASIAVPELKFALESGSDRFMQLVQTYLRGSKSIDWYQTTYGNDWLFSGKGALFSATFETVDSKLRFPHYGYLSFKDLVTKLGLYAMPKTFGAPEQRKMKDIYEEPFKNMLKFVRAVLVPEEDISITLQEFLEE